MTSVLASTQGLSREDWLQLRKRGIGGSDAAAIAGLNPYRSPAAVFYEKTGQLPDEEAGEAAYWGSTLEDVVAQEFAKRTGFKVQRRNAILQHPEYKFMLANIDRFVMSPDGRGVLECKTASEYRKGEFDDDKLPDTYRIQVQHYLAVTGLRFAYLAVLIGGNKYQHHLISRDEEIINHLVKIESDFWALVEAGTPPAIEGTAADADLMDLLYPEAKPATEIDLPPEAEWLIAQFETADAEEKAAKARKEQAATRLQDMLKENERGRAGDRLVSWPSISTARVDTKALKTKYPQVHAEVVKTTSYRRFGVK